MAVLKLKSDAGREGIKLICPTQNEWNSVEDSESKTKHNVKYSLL
jgi:hypothetical protein